MATFRNATFSWESARPIGFVFCRQSYLVAIFSKLVVTAEEKTLNIG
jgi:hypothetical protein